MCIRDRVYAFVNSSHNLIVQNGKNLDYSNNLVLVLKCLKRILTITKKINKNEQHLSIRKDVARWKRKGAAFIVAPDTQLTGYLHLPL